MKYLITISFFLCLFLQAQDEPFGPQPKMRKEVKKHDEAAKKKYAGNKDILILPGLIADKKAQTVRIWAESPGLQ